MSACSATNPIGARGAGTASTQPARMAVRSAAALLSEAAGAGPLARLSSSARCARARGDSVGQRIRGGGESKGLRTAQPRRQRGVDDLTERSLVVLGRKAREGEPIATERRHVVEDRACGPKLLRGDIGFGAQRDDDPRERAVAKRHDDPPAHVALARLLAGVVEELRERNVERDADDLHRVEVPTRAKGNSRETLLSLL